MKLRRWKDIWAKDGRIFGQKHGTQKVIPSHSDLVSQMQCLFGDLGAYALYSMTTLLASFVLVS
jgi:hypothetical protein